MGENIFNDGNKNFINKFNELPWQKFKIFQDKNASKHWDLSTIEVVFSTMPLETQRRVQDITPPCHTEHHWYTYDDLALAQLSKRNRKREFTAYHYHSFARDFDINNYELIIMNFVIDLQQKWSILLWK